ncbi:MAG TPA: SRPBCC domain-containing protein [Gammaproteobacteria bacterium]|nr:SRPBCC domain-containing protein [Gammaproteobacteria bacterium]
MATVIETQITIGATAERVWAVLTDFTAYARWNPFILRAEGTPEAGGRMTVQVARPRGRTRVFRPMVLMVAAPSQLRWLARLWLPGLLDVEHAFLIENDNGSGAVRLVQRARVEGFVALCLRRRLESELYGSFEAMNHALKRRVEQASGPSGRTGAG